MTWKRSVLVVANVTATSSELIQELTGRAGREPASFTLVVPATPFDGGRAAAQEKLDQAIEKLRTAGLEAEGTIGDADPLVAVTEAWDPKRFDEIVVSTLPMRFSKWLHAGLPERIARTTGAPVTHIIAHSPKPPVEGTPPPSDESAGAVMGPLGVLGWGRHEE